jgi:hypothetical protein
VGHFCARSCAGHRHRRHVAAACNILPQGGTPSAHPPHQNTRTPTFGRPARWVRQRSSAWAPSCTAAVHSTQGPHTPCHRPVVARSCGGHLA